MSGKIAAMAVVAFVAGSLTLAACSSTTSPSPAGSGGTAAAGAPAGAQPWVDWVKGFHPKDLKFAVVNYATTNPYFTPLQTGVADAAGQLGIKVDYTGTPTTDTAAQISQFKALVNQGYQAIIVIPSEADAWVQPINDAVAAGVLVLTTNSDSPASKREIFFGPDFYAGGQMQMQLVAKALGGKGTVAFTNCAPGLDSMTKRSNGNKDAAAAAGLTWVGEFPTDPSDPAKNKAGIAGIVRAHPDISAIAAGCQPDTVSAGAVKAETGGKFVVVGQDLASQTLAYIKDGTIYGTLGQNPYMQGWLPVMYAYSRVVLDMAPTELPQGNWVTGTEVVTKDNVDQFITREARFSK
jgi:simple sugar transport system substrate-binding protein